VSGFIKTCIGDLIPGVCDSEEPVAVVNGEDDAFLIGMGVFALILLGIILCMICIWTFTGRRRRRSGRSNVV